jgi:hypothetical protein
MTDLPNANPARRGGNIVNEHSHSDDEGRDVRRWIFGAATRGVGFSSSNQRPRRRGRWIEFPVGSERFSGSLLT